MEVHKSNERFCFLSLSFYSKLGTSWLAPGRSCRQGHPPRFPACGLVVLIIEVSPQLPLVGVSGQEAEEHQAGVFRWQMFQSFSSVSYPSLGRRAALGLKELFMEAGEQSLSHLWAAPMVNGQTEHLASESAFCTLWAA